MAEDEDLGEEFNRMIGRMSDPDAIPEVEVSEVAESASLVEVTVPISVYPHPELTLFRTITAYLQSRPRVAVMGVNISYEVRSHNLPFLVGTLFLGEPV